MRSSPGGCLALVRGRRPLGALVSLVAALLALVACAPATPPPTLAPTPTPRIRLTAVTVPGAHARLLAWARLYERDYPGVVVEVRLDTVTRVQEAAAWGSADLVAVDQALLPYYRDVLTVTHVADEPIALVVHPGNAVDSLSSLVLEQVLAGRVGHWVDIGGTADPIRLYLLPDSSGEVQYVDRVVLAGRRLAPQAVVCASYASLLRAVAADPGAIGLLPLNAVTNQVRLLGVDGFFPHDADYPWKMPLLLAYGPAAPPQAREFVRYVGRP